MADSNLERLEHSEESTSEIVLSLLKKYNISLDKWGQGSAKTVDHLDREVEGGESVLEERDGKLVRVVRVSWLNVFYVDRNGDRYKLIEKKQVFRDGRERVRSTEYSIAEKISKDEEAKNAARRCLREELGIANPRGINYSNTLKHIEESHSYPGVLSEYQDYIFDYIVSEGDYRPEGYVERQEDKDTYFEWVKIDK